MWVVKKYWVHPGDSDGEESACNVGDPGLIPGLGRSPEEGNGNSSILAWEIPWTEEPGGLQSIVRKELDTTQQLTLSRHIPTLKEWNL